MNLKTVTITLVLTVSGLFASANLLAETVTQNIFGTVIYIGTNADENIELRQDIGGDLILIVSDSINSTPRFYQFAGNNGLVMLTFAGDDTVTVNGVVSLGGPTYIDLGNDIDTFQCTSSASLSIDGDFNLYESDFINFSSVAATLDVSGNFLLSQLIGLSVHKISNCSVDGDFEYQGGDGYNSLFIGVDPFLGITIDGISVTGNILLNMAQNPANAIYSDYVLLGQSSCGGTLTINSGSKQDSIAVVNSVIQGAATITTFDEKDEVRIESSTFVRDLAVDTGKHNDSVSISSSSLFTCNINTRRGNDVITFTSSDFFTAVVHGGSGTDTGNRLNSTFTRGLTKIQIELGNF